MNKPTLAVVTHTNPHVNRDIKRCVDSVAAALPDGAKHFIVDCFSKDDLPQARVDAMSLGDFVCFVDDDDYITPESLKMCYNTLLMSTYGVVFTQEARVTDNREVISDTAKTYEDVLKGPRIMHHMSMIRTSAITARGMELAKQAFVGVEWVLKVDAGFNKGIVHIPVVGYYWCQHAQQGHRNTAYNIYEQQAKIKEEMRTWVRPAGKIAIMKLC